MLKKLKPNSASLLIVLFLLTLSVTLLSGFGPTTLNCKKVISGSTDCRLTKSVALGFINTQETLISNLTKAELDIGTGEIKQEVLDNKRVIVNGHRDTSIKIVKFPIYGTRLIGEPSMLFNGHSNNIGAQEHNVEEINNFLASDALQLKIKETPHGHHGFALGSLGLVIFVLFRMRG